MTDKLTQRMYVDQCLPGMDSLYKVLNHGTTYKIHSPQTLPRSNL